jgi:hypothetical protein
LAVLVDVANIVDRVDAGSEQAERRAGERYAPWHAVAARRTRGSRGGDHEHVLDPLSRAKRYEHGAKRTAAETGRRQGRNPVLAGYLRARAIQFARRTGI